LSLRYCSALCSLSIKVLDLSGLITEAMRGVMMNMTRDRMARTTSSSTRVKADILLLETRGFSLS
jgi:hypothetical protein